MPLVTAVVVLVFGGLTLVLHDETFIKLKPTIIYVLFGGALLGGLAFGKPLLGIVFDSVFDLTEEGWRKLTWRWALFFLALAVLNEIVWRTQSTDFWVSFKVFGVVPLTSSSARRRIRCSEVRAPTSRTSASAPGSLPVDRRAQIAAGDRRGSASRNTCTTAPRTGRNADEGERWRAINATIEIVAAAGRGPRTWLRSAHRRDEMQQIDRERPFADLDERAVEPAPASRTIALSYKAMNEREGGSPRRAG